MMNSVLRGLAGVGLVIALLAVSGCGQKGPLVPAPQAYNSR
ncbi:Prokaryotic lipoprotein-attachment site [Burkholderiales bacterium]